MFHKKEFQKRWILTVLSVVVSILILPTLTQAGEILFEDTFDKANDKLNGTGKWHTVSGAWVIKNGQIGTEPTKWQKSYLSVRWSLG